MPANTEANRELTFGEKAVGITFNPSNDPYVQEIKQQCAAVIDTLNAHREQAKVDNNSEKIRMYSVAITEIQTAQMWGVKAATWQG